MKKAVENLSYSSPSFHLVFWLAVHSIVVREPKRDDGFVSHGGSSSAATGAIWLAVQSGVTVADLEEMLVHELAHHLLFIHEFNIALFDYKKISKKNNYCYSAILNRNRPLDKTLHSIVVATEILAWRIRNSKWEQETIVHPSSPKMLSEILVALESCRNNTIEHGTLTYRAKQILDHCENIVREFN